MQKLSKIMLIGLGVYLANNTFANTFVDNAKLNADVRLRYENVDTNNSKEDANAVTARAKFGVTSGVYQGFSAGIEGEGNTVLQNDFNSTRNNKAQYNTVVDPKSLELNKLWLKYDFAGKGDVTVGRQAINLDNQRFVGGVAWRQNEQTYDAAVLNIKANPQWGFYYAYINQVNTIWGSEKAEPAANNVSQPSKVASKNNLVQVRYKNSDALNLVGYGYLLDLGTWSNGAQSSQTYGLRATGKFKEVPLRYVAEYAYQRDYANQPLTYHANYESLEAAYVFPSRFKKGELVAGYEKLGSDAGKQGFQTPLATKHKFNGWADQFLTTPKNGLRDYYITSSIAAIAKVNLGAEYHYYTSDKFSTFYGDEIGVVASSPLPYKGLSVLTKFSNFNAKEKGFTDTQKYWLQLEYKY